MKTFFQEIWQLIKDFYYFIVNYFFLLWAHSPILSLTSDANFTNLQFPRKNTNIRFSLVSLYFGEYIFHVITWSFAEKNFRLIKKISLSSLEIFNTDDETPEFKKKITEFKNHILVLSDEDKSIEKEALIRNIENESARINKSDTKLNIYSAIILAIISIANFKSLNNFSTEVSFKSILLILTIYFFINICAIIIQNIKVKGFNTSTFKDLRESDKKKDCYLEQLYYDYCFSKEKANLYVSYICRIYDYIKILIALFIMILSMNIANIKPSKQLDTAAEGRIITISLDNLSNVYSSDSIDLSEFLLLLQKNQYSRILVLSKKSIPKEINDKISLFDRQKFHYIIDKNLSENAIKIIAEE